MLSYIAQFTHHARREARAGNCIEAEVYLERAQKDLKRVRSKVRRHLAEKQIRDTTKVLRQHRCRV
jgi:hypothetical protein